MQPQSQGSLPLNMVPGSPQRLLRNVFQAPLFLLLRFDLGSARSNLMSTELGAAPERYRVLLNMDRQEVPLQPHALGIGARQGVGVSMQGRGEPPPPPPVVFPALPLTTPSQVTLRCLTPLLP